MDSGDLLVMVLALPSMWLAATLWWSERHAVDALRESAAFASTLAQRDDGHALDRRALDAAEPAPRVLDGRW